MTMPYLVALALVQAGVNPVSAGDPPAAFKEIRRYTVADKPTWAHPAVVGDGLLVKDAESLAYLRF